MSGISPIIRAVDVDTLAIDWGPMTGGDFGLPAQAYGYPHLTWQLTGSGGSSIYPPAFPPTPMAPDRSIDIMGSLDGTCWCNITTLTTNPDIGDQLHDPFFYQGENKPRFRFYMPIVRGATGSPGDCGLLLFAYRLFGPRV
jgi:hypothetical protein